MAGSPLRRERREAELAQAVAAEAALGRSPLPTQFSEPATYDDQRIGELLRLADDGYAPVEVAALWNVDMETVQGWEDAHPSFAAAIRRARVREQAWWMARARSAIRDDNNRFPAGAWSHVMRARFPDFADTSGVTVNIDLRSLVMIDARSPGLLGEQGVIDAESLPSKEGDGNRLTFGRSDDRRGDAE